MGRVFKLRVIKLDAMALLELPRGCDYWNDERMRCMIDGTESHIHDFDGCMHSLTTQFGGHRIPIKKSWRIVSWGAKFDLHRKCDRKHDHGKCEGRETKVTQTYTNQIVDIILKSVRRHMSIRFKESLAKTDDTCRSCEHDRRSAKKTAVSITYDIDEIAADLMWLMMYHVRGCLVNACTDISGFRRMEDQLPTTFTTSSSSCITGRAIGNLHVYPRQGVRDPWVNGKPGVYQHRLVRDPSGTTAMSNYSPIIGSAQHDVNDIRSILVTLRDNGKQGVIPVMYIYEPTCNSLPDSTVDRWHAIGISPIAAASACFLGKVWQSTIDSIRSECHHIVPSDLRVDQEPRAEPRSQKILGQMHHLHEDLCSIGVSKQPQSPRILHHRMHQ